MVSHVIIDSHLLSGGFMKKDLIIFFCVIILFSITGCKNSQTDEISNIDNQQENTTQIRIENYKNITWNEITKDGVDEQELLDNINMDILEEIANLFQTLDKEIAEKENISPEYVLRGNWVTDVIESEQYKKVISMGNKAMKPLYWIIYKSNNEGRYEYICALALEELSNFNFDEDGDGMKWASSKEFLEEFNTKVIDN